MLVMAGPPLILDEKHRLVLRAALAEGRALEVSYRAWRASLRLDDIDNITFRVLPLLLETSDKLGVHEPGLMRLRGMVKHIWLKNILRIKLLTEALVALRASRIETVLLKGAALIARDQRSRVRAYH